MCTYMSYILLHKHTNHITCHVMVHNGLFCCAIPYPVLLNHTCMLNCAMLHAHSTVRGKHLVTSTSRSRMAGAAYLQFRQWETNLNVAPCSTFTRIPPESYIEPAVLVMSWQFHLAPKHALYIHPTHPYHATPPRRAPVQSLPALSRRAPSI